MLSQKEIEIILKHLKKQGKQIPVIAEEQFKRDISMQDLRDKSNIQLLETLLEEVLEKKTDARKLLSKHGFSMVTPEDYELLLRSYKYIDIPLEPDYQHFIRYKYKGWDWNEIEPNLLHGSMGVWKKDNRFYYCEGFIDKKTGEKSVLCRRIY